LNSKREPVENKRPRQLKISATATNANEQDPDKIKYLYFRSSQCLNHESIILRQEKDTTTFPWRRKFPQSIVSTNGHHIVSSINLEQLSQISATDHKVIYNNHMQSERKREKKKRGL